MQLMRRGAGWAWNSDDPAANLDGGAAYLARA